jgi:DNA ligase-associated metallophosphoesterase
MKSYALTLGKHQMELHPCKFLFWKTKSTLILSDIHLGKAAHFRKHGVSLPANSGTKDLVLLHRLLSDFQPNRLLILGDLFHSEHNDDWEYFGKLRRTFPFIRFELVPGNHDLLEAHHYTQHGITVLPAIVKEEEFVFSHEPIPVEDPFINICGHVHPGHYMEGKGKNGLRLPCFYFHKQTLLLPAFGKLTGLYCMPKHKTAQVFVVAGSSVLKVVG